MAEFPDDAHPTHGPHVHDGNFRDQPNLQKAHAANRPVFAGLIFELTSLSMHVESWKLPTTITNISRHGNRVPLVHESLCPREITAKEALLTGLIFELASFSTAIESWELPKTIKNVTTRQQGPTGSRGFLYLRKIITKEAWLAKAAKYFPGCIFQEVYLQIPSFCPAI